MCGERQQVDTVCPVCNGSGEGRCPDCVCMQCGGSGLYTDRSAAKQRDIGDQIDNAYDALKEQRL